MQFVLKSLSSGIILLGIFAKYGISIMCYDCNSAYDPRCGEEFDSFSLGVVNCSLRDPPDHIEPVESTFCRSIKMEIFGKVRVVRQCGFLPDAPGQPPCWRHSGVGDVFVTHCSCHTDLCNEGFRLRGRDKALIGLSTILLLFV